MLVVQVITKEGQILQDQFIVIQFMQRLTLIFIRIQPTPITDQTPPSVLVGVQVPEQKKL